VFGCLKLEERVITLENELLATQKGVTNNYYTGTKNNENRGQQMGTVNAFVSLRASIIIPKLATPFSLSRDASFCCS
jgi:hypothetical protein